MPTTYRLTATEQVTVLERSPEAIVADVRYDAAGDPPPPHLHPFQDERFEVLGGELTVQLGGRRRTLTTGEILEIPRNTAHQMWNAHLTDGARVRWTTSPALRTEEWWSALDHHQGPPTLMSFAPLLREYRDAFRLTVPPQWIAQPLFAALSVGRRPATPERA